MGLVGNLLFLLSSAALLLIAVQKDYAWTITEPIKEENYSRAYSLLESFEFFTFHPFYHSHRLISKTGEERVYEISENLEKVLGFKTLMTNQMKFYPVNSNTFMTVAHVPIFYFFNFTFKIEFSITKTEITENAHLSGPLIVSYLMKTISYPQHVVIMEKLTNNL